jgi:thioredoxin-related protein
MLRRTILALCIGLAGPAAAAETRLELLFVDRAGCSWCARFEKEVLPGYPHSDLGQAAPLARASLDAGQPKHVTLDEPIRFTPTFVLLTDGRETGRIVGYMDNGTFYGLLGKLIAEKTGRRETAK